MPYLRNIEFKPRYSIQENSYNDINFEKRTNMFKGTIIICVAYGLFAFILMSYTAFSPTARVVLFDNFLPFTVVYIIGTILIICLMLYYIFSYIPVNITYRLDGITCPDYWDVELLDDNYINNSFDPQYPSSYFKYKCVMNKDIFDTKTMFIDSSNLPNTDKEKSYKHTNILAGIKPAGGTYNGLAGSYDVNSNLQFYKDINNYKQYAKIYKDINQYSSNNIQDYINTKSDTLSLDIINNLKNIALVQNNYKVISKYNKESITDIIGKSNMWNSTSPSVSPITWNYATSTTNSVGLGTTSVATISVDAASTISAMILDWKDLKADKAFYGGYDLPLKSDDDKKSVKKGLIVYYNPSESVNNLNLLGKIEITSNSANNPTISMKFIPSVLGTFTSADSPKSSYDYILNSDNIIISKEEKDISYLTKNASSNYITLIKLEVGSKMNLTNKPIFQLYDTAKTRPATISRTDFTNSSNPIPLSCDELYPAFLESMDDDQNNVRCAYSKICRFPWSDLRCPLENTAKPENSYK
jgi:hypothetical protein